MAQLVSPAALRDEPEESNMAEKALRNAAAGSLPEPEASASSQDASCFLQRLTDRQLQVMLAGLHQMFTRDEIARLNTDIEEIVTAVTKKAVIPALCEGLRVDARSLFIASPGSSNLFLESVTKEVAHVIVKTVIEALEEKQDSHKLELHESVTEKTELQDRASCGSVELLKSSLSVEPSTENLMSKDQAKLQECEIHTIYRSEELMRALGLSGPSKTCTTDFGDCLLSELDDTTTSSQSSLRDDISSDPACSALADEDRQRAKSVHGISSLMNRSNMSGKVETSVPVQCLMNVSPYAEMIVDELLAQEDLFTSSEGSEDAQSAHRQCSSDTSLISEFLVDHLMAHIEKVSGSSFGHGIPAKALDGQKPTFLQNLSGKSLQKIRSEDTRTKAAQEVGKILFLTSDRLLESSLHSQRAHTSRQDCSVERTPSECLFKASNLVNSVIDRIYEGLHSCCGPLECMESRVDVSEMLWYIACTTYYSTMRHLKDFTAVYQEKAPKFNPTVSPEDFVFLPGIPTPQPFVHKLPLRMNDKYKGRERVSMATLVDTMMASLGLQSSGHLNSVEDISAAAKRADGLFSTAATEKFTKLVQLMLTDRSCENFSYFPFLQQSFASEFLAEFAEKSVKRLLTSCIAPREASAATANIPTLVMPFRPCPESFEFARPPSEVFDDTVDLISDAIVNNIMDKVTELSEYELDDELSNDEETSQSDSHSSEKLRTSRGLVEADRKHHACLTTWLILRVLAQLEPSSSDVRKEASSNDRKELTERILRELSASSSAAKLEEVLSGTSVELLQRFGEEGSLKKALNPRDSTFDEALMTALRKHLGADASTAVPETEGVKSVPSKKRKGIFHLKMPKLRIFKDIRSFLSRSSNATSKKEKPRNPSIFTKMFSCLRKSAVFCI
ncbi:hypothetical protein AOLI_G00118030 [Acnodon oligacanthus]